MRTARIKITTAVPRSIQASDVTSDAFEEAASLTIPNQGISGPAIPDTQICRTAVTGIPFSSLYPEKCESSPVAIYWSNVHPFERRLSPVVR